MSKRIGQRPDFLSLAAFRRVDEVCLRFETALQGGAARIEDYLGDAPEPERSGLLRWLLPLEVEYRRRRGEQPTADEYRERFPTQASSIATWYPAEPTIGCDAPVEATPSWPNLPGYEIVAELGRGGMGVVYQARHLKSQRVVGLKMILAGEHASAEQTARFLAEARAVARLQHPNIVQIHDIGEHNGLPYFSLEYVDGGNLAARLKGSPPSDMEAACLVEILARAVHYAHGRGIVHRDLKPANILLTNDGVPKIADFGLAKILDDDSGATRTGAIVGTASYMPPETAAGKIREIGPAADVYALGAILYELLTDRPPFRGESMLETLRMVQEQDPEPPHVYNRRVDRSLEAICLKCLKKTPTDRYPSAKALAEDLARFRTGEPVQAPSGIVSDWIGAAFKESPHIEFMTLWGRGIMTSALSFFLSCVAWYSLVANGVEQYAPYYAILVAKAATDFGVLVWWFRLKNGPPLRHFESQILRIKFFFWMLIFLTVWQYQRAGGPIAGFFPIVVSDVAFAYCCAATMLGGSFYPTAAAFFGVAILQTFWPEFGPLISALAAPALFWVGWKFSRRIPGRQSTSAEFA